MSDCYCLIIAAGPIDDYCAQRALLAGLPAPLRVYCADGGLRHAGPLGVTPDVVVGDFDSADAELMDSYAKAGARFERHPANKDFTDTELAAEAALRGGCGAALILGALGGRLDHTFANIQMIYKFALRGARLVLADSCGAAAVLVPGTVLRVEKRRPAASLLALEAAADTSATASATASATSDETSAETSAANADVRARPDAALSILPIGGPARGLKTYGLKYALDGADVEGCYTTGVSNEFSGGEAGVQLAEGAALVMVCADRPPWFAAGRIL